MATDQEIQAARVLGISVEEWRRRGTAAMRANRDDRVGGGTVMCRVEGGRVVRMDAADGDGDDSSTPAEMCAQAQEHLNHFIKAPGAKNAHEHIARASAMCSAALARCARNNAERASASPAFRG